MHFLSQYGIDVLEKRIREAIAAWQPEELFIFKPVWKALRPALDLPLGRIAELIPPDAPPAELAPRGWGFAAEQMQDYAVPKIALLLMNVFAHLLLEEPSGKVSETRVMEAVRLYAKACTIRGFSEQDLATRLTPLLLNDFTSPAAPLTYTPETFTCLDSESRTTKPVPVPVEEIEVWRDRGQSRWLFLDDLDGMVHIGRGKEKEHFDVGRRQRRLLLELLLRAKIGAVAYSTLYEELWGMEGPPTEHAFTEALSSMHRQTGTLLQEFIIVERRAKIVRIHDLLPPFCAIWFPRSRQS